MANKKEVKSKELEELQKLMAQQTENDKEEVVEEKPSSEEVKRQELTLENYYSQELGRKYMSSHNLMDFIEDKTIFWLKNQTDWLTRKESDSLIVGNLFHAFMESKVAFYNFLKENTLNLVGKTEFKKLITKAKNVYGDDNGEELSDDKIHEYANVLFAEQVFEDGPQSVKILAKPDEVWQYIIRKWEERERLWTLPPNTAHEAVLTGNLFGVPFKARLDVLQYDPETKTALIYDYKTSGLKEKYQYGRYYNPELEAMVGKNFIQQYNYDLQMWIYRRIVAKHFNIPEENVKVQFGVFVKKFTTAFTEVPGGFINTNYLTDDDLLAPRFKGPNGENINAEQVVREYAQEAYELANTEQAPDYVKNSLTYQMLNRTQETLHINKFHI